MEQNNPFSEPDSELNELARQVIGAAIEVHRELGPGLIEEIYERALCSELNRRNIPFSRQVVLPVRYKGDVVGECRLDLLVAGRLIVELKAVDALAPIHKAQVITYLRVTKFKLALLMNFNVPVLKDGIQRIILS
jgi:GxxExxY protein